MGAKTEMALSKFREGYNCAQSVLYAFCRDFEIDQDVALRIATGFGGGMGRRGEVCGAVSGGIMVLGLRYGMGEKNDKEAKELTYRKTRELVERFVRRHGAVDCRSLLGGCDLTTRMGQVRFKREDLLSRVCKPCVQSVVEMVEEMV
jgi:C_GCAxxG_C_C family probable redox protein